MAGTARAEAPGAGAPSAGVFGAELARQSARLRALRGRPEAAAPLAALAALYDDVPDGAVEAVLREVADAAGTDPLVAAQASYLVARTADDRGDAAAAERRRAALGLLTRFWVVGPFGDGRASLAQPFPPETEEGVPDPARRYPGKEREVGWRKGQGAVRAGELFLDGLLRPALQTTGYALAFVRADRAQAAALRFGSSGPVKIWVNGALVATRDVVRAAAFDQDACGVRLRKGWNRVLIKSVITDGAWRLYARLTDPAGRPLPVVGADAPPATDAPAAGAAAIARPPARAPPPVAVVVASLEASLARRARAARGAAAAEAWADLGRFRAFCPAGDREARDDAAALERAVAIRPTGPTLALLAEVARDDDERRRILERALAAAAKGPDAEQALALARLGDVARDQHRELDAPASWRAALQADAACWPASLGLAAEEQAAGLTALAVARIEALPEATRRLPRVMRDLARLYGIQDRNAEGDRMLGDILRVRRDDVEVAHELARRARERGDADGAIELLRRAAAARPDLPALTIELARALEGAGQRGPARAALEDLAARLPDDPSARAQLGKLLHRAGERARALVELRAAVALRPQDPELRRYTERAAADRDQAEAPHGEDLARRYAAEIPALLASVGSGKGAPDAVDPAVVLLDRRVVRVHRNGLAETFAQRVVEVRTDRGAEDNREFEVRYTPGVEEVEIRRARIWRRAAGGGLEALEVSERDDEDLSEPWYGLYYDNRAEVVRFEGLRAGDVLEVQYLVDDVSSANQMADYFGDLQFIAESIPKRLWDYTLIGPADRTFYFNTPHVPGLERAASALGGEKVQRFAARDVAKIESEPAMPGYTEVAPYLHVSTYATWRDVGAWYWRMVEEQMVPDESVRKAARSVLVRGMTDEQKVRAIHGLVVSGTRYVGLEFGIHGFKPYKVTQVLARRFGDCKDKATLMIALLREVGVDAELVLLRTRRGGRIDPQPASLAVFDHAIAYVPKLGLYLDGTAEFSGTRELPSQDQGVTVLRVGARGAELVETPVLPSSENRADRRWDVELQPSGEARVTETLTITGQAAPEWREHYQTPGERMDRYGKVWTGRYPGATLLSLDMPGIDDRNRPVTVRAVATVPRLGQSSRGARDGDGGATGPAAGQGEGDAGELDLPVTVRDADFARTYARLSARREDLLIAYPWQHEEELVFHLPAGWRVAALPPARAAESPFGRFRLDVSADGDRTVRVRSSLDVNRYRIAPADYARFRAFLGEIDAALAGRITVEKVAS
jgi:hypothetical protein